MYKRGTSPPYHFTYDTRHELPQKTSLCYDVWGYYNGVTPYNQMEHDYPERVEVGNTCYFDWEFPKKTNSTLIKGGRNIRCNPEYTTTGMLKKIKFPTGGYAEFTFEANAYRSMSTTEGEEKRGGGCRIARIKTDASERVFQYDDGYGRTSGILLVQPIFSYLMSVVANGRTQLQRYVLSSRSVVQLGGTQLGNYVGYSRVSETVTCDGKRSATIDHFFNDAEMLKENLYVHALSNQNGHLEKTLLYEDTKLVRETKYDYWTLPLNKTPNLDAMKFDDGIMYCYRVFPKYHELLSGKHVTDYYGKEKLFISTSYEYDDNLCIKRTEKKVNGKSEITETTYSGTLSKGVFQTLKEKNMVTLPVETTTLWSDGTTKKVIGSELTTYNENGQPVNVYKLEANEPITGFVPYSDIADENGKDTHYSNIPEMSIGYYDNNPQAVHYRDGRNVYYIWGYYSQYIIGKVENTTPEEMNAYLTEYNPLDVPNTTIYNKINGLRNQLPQANVTTYYYDYGIGLKQCTLPNDVSEYYEYDEENRLKCIKDESGNVLEQYKYGYKQ